MMNSPNPMLPLVQPQTCTKETIRKVCLQLVQEIYHLKNTPALDGWNSRAVSNTSVQLKKVTINYFSSHEKSLTNKKIQQTVVALASHVNKLLARRDNEDTESTFSDILALSIVLVNLTLDDGMSEEEVNGMKGNSASVEQYFQSLGIITVAPPKSVRDRAILGRVNTTASISQSAKQIISHSPVHRDHAGLVSSDGGVDRERKFLRKRAKTIGEDSRGAVQQFEPLTTSTPTTLHGWLSANGFLEYSCNFLQNGYEELSVVSCMNEEDLKKIGINSYTARRKIVIAISHLATVPKTATPTVRPKVKKYVDEEKREIKREDSKEKERRLGILSGRRKVSTPTKNGMSSPSLFHSVPIPFSDIPHSNSEGLPEKELVISAPSTPPLTNLKRSKSESTKSGLIKHTEIDDIAKKITSDLSVFGKSPKKTMESPIIHQKSDKFIEIFSQVFPKPDVDLSDSVTFCRSENFFNAVPTTNLFPDDKKFPSLRIDLSVDSWTSNDWVLEKTEDYYATYFCGSPHFNFSVTEENKEVSVVSVLANPIKGNVFMALHTSKKNSQLFFFEVDLNCTDFDAEVKKHLKTYTGNRPILQIPNYENFEKEFVKLEQQHPQSKDKMKIGVIYCRAGQTNPQHMLKNGFDGTPCSDHFWDFVNLLGEKISLEGWKGYRGDMRPGENSSTTPYYRKWRDIEIIYHVAPLLNSEGHRRLIGNDISIIFFIDEGPFDPFEVGLLGTVPQVFAVVRPEKKLFSSESSQSIVPLSLDVSDEVSLLSEERKTPASSVQYRIGFFSNVNIKSTLPLLPSQAVSAEILPHLLLTKIYNAQKMTSQCPPLNRLFYYPRGERLKEILRTFPTTKNMKNWIRNKDSIGEELED
eukprot:TRINITY_DN20177_c0_g1_i1.p1 TRINITY_DN20177_c0_g1~~TRINITY_DN20177_c0_g1_i1.p1  ORF type:complete len:868 (+),score=172.66 TRINITY_DN20177_c0_g1_i1:113-2716(+)